MMYTPLPVDESRAHLETLPLAAARPDVGRPAGARYQRPLQHPHPPPCVKPIGDLCWMTP
jgi:hypothetical protein